MTIADNTLQKLCVRWNNDDTHLAAACEDGSVRIYSADTGHYQRSLICRLGADSLPVTGLRWRPYSEQTKTKHVLVSISSEGAVMHWHAASGKMLSRTVVEDAQLLSMDYKADATQFVVGAKDARLRIFDESTRDVVSDLSHGDMTRSGHVNSIFAVKWYDENIVVSGGWDRNLNFWDVRTGRTEAAFFGPNCCGESIDCRGDSVLVGSHDITSQVQLWSLGERRQVLACSFPEDEGVTLVLSAQFTKHDGGRTIIAGGSGANAAYLLDSSDLSLLSVVRLPAPCFTLDNSPSFGRFALGSADGVVRIYNVRGR
jgi:WD40 repeat protein